MKLFAKHIKLRSYMEKILCSNFITASLIGAIATAFCFSFVSCNKDNTAPQPTPGQPDPQAYFVNTAWPIDPEYQEYLLVQNSDIKEERPIFIGGTLGRNPDLNVYGKVWWSYSAYGKSYSGGHTGFGNYADSYYDSTNGKYTARVILNPNFELFGCPQFNIIIGNGVTSGTGGTTLFTVRIISARTYPIKYSYQVGCELFGSSYELDKRLTKAFADAGTKVTHTEEKTNLPVVTISPGTFTGAARYVQLNISTDTSNRFRLISVSDISDINSDVLGITWHYPETGTLSYEFSFVIYNHAINRFSGDKLKKILTYTTIHELGHGRSIYGRITDDMQNTGHNGINKKLCVMRSGFSADSDTLNLIINNPVFCSGHQQYLLNQEYY